MFIHVLEWKVSVASYLHHCFQSFTTQLEAASRIVQNHKVVRCQSRLRFAEQLLRCQHTFNGEALPPIQGCGLIQTTQTTQSAKREVITVLQIERPL